MENIIYFDNAAATRMDERVLEAMLPYLKGEYANPNGRYSIGYAARKAVNEARIYAAKMINAEPDEIYFNSGGTEGNNTVINGFVRCKSSTKADSGSRKTIISTGIEHDSVLNAIKNPAKYGAEHILLEPDSEGTVSPKSLKEVFESKGLTGDGLVSVMFVNNEIGTAEPVKELADISHEHGFLFHTDAVQAAGHMEIDVKSMGIDMLSVSGHKLYGPKGSGFVYIKRGIGLSPLIFGGGQERGIRSGTENVPGIVGLGKACEIAFGEAKKNLIAEEKIGSFIKERIMSAIPDSKQNGNGSRILNFSFKGINGSSLCLRLDMEGICVSTGSACSLSSNLRSHVLKAIGLNDQDTDSSIRISIGKYNSMEEAEFLVQCIERLVRELRSYSV